MRRCPAILVSAILVLACLLVQVDRAWAAPAKKAKTTKDLILIELTAIQRDVAADRWESAWARSVKLGVYWAQYRRTHPGLKKGTLDRFAKGHRNLQLHLRRREKFRIYLDLGVLRTIVFILKA
ncbi:MAG: hypothetical protein K6U80_18345 [Firmicutes bacterium]|nr:hypothetical protein [Bacillota bacterium]